MTKDHGFRSEMGVGAVGVVLTISPSPNSTIHILFNNERMFLNVSGKSMQWNDASGI